MRVLLGTDGSDTARAAVQFTAAFPFPSGTEVVLLAVQRNVLPADDAEDLAPEHQAVLARNTDDARRTLDELLAAEAGLLRSAGLSVTTEIRSGHPPEEIVAAGDEHDVDLIVVGSHGLTGFRRFFLGSVSTAVLQASRRSVLIVRRPEQGHELQHAGAPALTDHPWRILVGFDGSAMSHRAIDVSLQLDLEAQSSVHVLTVLPMLRHFRQDIRQEFDVIWQQRKAAEKQDLHEAAERLRGSAANVSSHLVEATDVSEAILEAADDFDADLIVLGNKGGGAIERFLLGSVTPKVAHHALRSVLVVR